MHHVHGPCATVEAGRLIAPGAATDHATSRRSAGRIRMLRAPATKSIRVIKRLCAVLWGGVCVSNARGSTVEARGAEVLHTAS